jgi:hypothetical protein
MCTASSPFMSRVDSLAGRVSFSKQKPAGLSWLAINKKEIPIKMRMKDLKAAACRVLFILSSPLRQLKSQMPYLWQLCLCLDNVPMRHPLLGEVA